MDLKNQVVNLALAKRLKELGFIQDSLFYWKPGKNKEICHRVGMIDKNGLTHVHDFQWQIIKKSESKEPGEIKYFERLKKLDLIFSAFTCSELGDLLPMEIDGRRFEVSRIMATGEWVVGYMKKRGKIYFQVGDNEVEARAKILIHLKDNGLIKN
jgi:hypothetical protein